MSRRILIIIILISCILLTGCWSYREINSIYIIAGIGIDKVEESNQYNITAELINIKDNKREQSFESLLVETKGDSILDATTKMVRISGKEAYWGHAASIIISEEVAREGIIPFLDFIARNEAVRLGSNIYIAKDRSAKDVLQVESLPTEVRSFELDVMINESKHLVKVPVLKTYEVINALAIPKFNIVLPTVVSYSNDGKDTNQLSGGSVFNKEKLVGFLKEEDIIPYLFIKNKVEAGILNIKDPGDNPDDIIILKIFGSNTKITPKYGDETIGFDVIVKTDVSIGELTTMTDYISTQGRENLKILAEESLEKEIVNFIKNVQDEFGFDIFGFGNIIRQRNPKMWAFVEDDWDSIFMDMDINVVCDIQIRNSGYTLKTIKVVD